MNDWAKLDRPRDPRAVYQDGVAEVLTAAGFAPQAVVALLEFDASMFGMMRSMVKGELPAQLMAELGTGLELAQFQALTAILRITYGIGRPEPQEVTIGLVAAELNLDPSRASRSVADLIAAGHVRRDVSQDDGRRSVLHLTAKAHDLLTAFRELKWRKAAGVFAGWEEGEIVQFSRLFTRYNEAMRRTYPRRE